MDGHAMAGSRTRLGGPQVSAVPFRHSETGLAAPLLTDDERGRLALIASIAQFEPGEAIVREGQPATCIFNLVSGAVKTFTTLPSGHERGQAFLFADDLLGLAEDGRYLNTAIALTRVTAYRLPLPSLERLLRGDSDLQLHFLCKVCHELREAQRHAVTLARNDARSRVALFLHLLENHPSSVVSEDGCIHLPMSRADIADYVGLTLESVSRALHRLQRDGIIRLQNPRTVGIVDRAKFEKLLAA